MTVLTQTGYYYSGSKLGISVVSSVIVMHTEGPGEAVPLLHVLAGRITCQCGSVSPRLCSY